MGRPSKRLLRLLECGVCFFGLPSSLYLVRRQIAFHVIPILLVLGALCALYLVRSGAIELRALWSPSGGRVWLRGILQLFVPVAILLAVLAGLFLRTHFLTFPVDAPMRWAGFMLLYPVLAAYPQELVFRAFFFARYGSLFSSPLLLVLCNGVSFGLAHLFYGNWIAVVLATMGGLLFAYRYVRTGSLLAAAVEHGLWGNFLFTIGVGWYFYSGSIR